MNALISRILFCVALALPALAFAQADRPRDLGNVIDDTAITAKVKGEFVRDNEVNALDVAVTTRNGDVQLSGVARNVHEADRAVRIARSVPGVRSVSSAIDIRAN
jgi:hyperosmotically inducible protein